MEGEAMTRRLSRAGLLLVVMTLPLAPYGCTSVQQQRTQATEDLLTSAGFKVRPADTPEKLTHLNTLQPFKVIQRSKDGQPVYTYADPEFCKCLYAGGPQQFQEFKRLKAQKQEETTELIATEDSSLNWGMWGTPWW
jgi:hypothetical protein